ncbi:MAG TPA: undecaprenyl-diphosphate phosphatase, partial [Candidatus Saccharimonadia bacterium]|nr:undecaprenyl-diphosphate phosphatase [Candidatus Saccharimonadia bacterium]
LIQHLAETTFRSSRLVAFNLIWVGVVMFIIDRYSRRNLTLSHVNMGRALSVGVAQTLALVPGVSRSGITITMSRALGLDRVDATRFSFLLSAPIITGATLKVLLGHEAREQIAAAPSLYAVGIVAAAVSGYFSIKFLISYLSKHGLALFAVYRVAIGLLILAVGLQ